MYLSIVSVAVLCVMKLQSVRVKDGCKLSCAILYLSPVYHTLSKALATSLSTTSVVSRRALQPARSSVNVAKAVCVPLCLRNPCCLILYKLCVVKCCASLLLRILSKSFEWMSMSEMGR